MIFYRIAEVTFLYPNGEYKSWLKFDSRKCDDIGFTLESLVKYIMLIGNNSNFIIEKDRFYPYCKAYKSLSREEFLRLKTN